MDTTLSRKGFLKLSGAGGALAAMAPAGARTAFAADYDASATYYETLHVERGCA